MKTPQEKIVCVIEKILEDHALHPKDTREINIPAERLSYPCELALDQLEHILEKLKHEGVIIDFIRIINRFDVFTGFQIQLPENFYEKARAVQGEFAQEPKRVVPQIHYNKQTGVGFVDGAQFKFKDHQPEYRVFAEMYKQVNNTVPRNEVLALMGLLESENRLGQNENSNESVSKTAETYKINELAKKMRKRTRLNKNTLVMNNGNLTLVGKVLETPPK